MLLENNIPFDLCNLEIMYVYNTNCSFCAVTFLLVNFLISCKKKNNTYTYFAFFAIKSNVINIMLIFPPT